MTKQPNAGGGEENAAAATPAQHKSSSGVNPDQGPKPDPKCVQQDYTITIASVNENQIGKIENEGIKSANGLNKSKKSVHWSQELVTESSVQRKTGNRGSNPYLAHSPAPANNSASVNIKNKMENVKDVLGRWGKKVGEATKKAEDIAGNTWQHCKASSSSFILSFSRFLFCVHGHHIQGIMRIRSANSHGHCLGRWDVRRPYSYLYGYNNFISLSMPCIVKTSPSIADAALGRIAQGTRVLAEGGYDKIFRQTFEADPEEQLRNSFACYLSTSAGPVMGVLYLSTVKLAFCSDNPLPYTNENKTEWSYYKVIIPLHQLKTIYPSSKQNLFFRKVHPSYLY
ncbi:hypothetical protein H5410_054708 [Solanum commersonii]|uniref:GRAM domain-containing protein n=1 Tax=Solanum commersonii TaxID=4109 RepID=A0A9J5WI96_SOLCO|nr:hypothetical protein H5410_054708 [Solanum commersonii]